MHLARLGLLLGLGLRLGLLLRLGLGLLLLHERLDAQTARVPINLGCTQQGSAKQCNVNAQVIGTFMSWSGNESMGLDGP